MRTFKFYLRFITSAVLPMLAVSCGLIANDEDGDGILRLHFSESSYTQTKVSDNIPDTSDFLLVVTNASGAILYKGKFGDSPEELIVKAGTYNISAYSSEFKKPAFSAPQYGDEQCVSVVSGQSTDVWLTCSQINSGIKLDIDKNFLTSYPDGVLFLKSNDGKLMYGYSEKRIAYFAPGNVSLILNEKNKDQTLFTKVLKAREILNMKITSATSQGTSSEIHIQVDTSRNWGKDSFHIGGTDGTGGGQEIDKALNVSQAKDNIGSEDVWVYGYIVGGDLTSSSISFSTPFASSTNIAIAGRTSVKEKEACLSVQLSKGAIRDALNLVDNPNNLRRKVYIKGDIVESYFGIPGIKNISRYHLE